MVVVEGLNKVRLLKYGALIGYLQVKLRYAIAMSELVLYWLQVFGLGVVEILKVKDTGKERARLSIYLR